jgi:LmbE family N-acetylglucosaminyl deacetylase
MCIFAHPDDETLGAGGTLAKYAAEGVETYLVTATRGERGWFGAADDNPGPAELGRMREAELRAAAVLLGLREVNFLDYVDGDLDQADPSDAIAELVGHLRRVRPQVVVTFSPDGAYGHPDHIAISQFAHAAVVCAAHAGAAHAGAADAGQAAPHRVQKFYYMVDSKSTVDLFETLMGGAITMPVDGVERRQVAWEEWAVTTRIDAAEHWQTVLKAILCHKTQLPSLGAVADWPEDTHRRIWGNATFYRAFSLVNGGRIPETDLFAGLR